LTVLIGNTLYCGDVIQKMARKAVTNRLELLYANMLKSAQSCDGWVVKTVLRLRIAATSIQSTPL